MIERIGKPAFSFALLVSGWGDIDSNIDALSFVIMFISWVLYFVVTPYYKRKVLRLEPIRRLDDTRWRYEIDDNDWKGLTIAQLRSKVAYEIDDLLYTEPSNTGYGIEKK